MKIHLRSMFFTLLLSLASGCGSTSDAPADDAAQETSGDEGLPPDVEVVEREVLTEDECAERGGEIIGDPGDGRTHQPDFVCPSGVPPIGSVRSGIEGAACCPR